MKLGGWDIVGHLVVPSSLFFRDGLYPVAKSSNRAGRLPLVMRSLLLNMSVFWPCAVYLRFLAFNKTVALCN